MKKLLHIYLILLLTSFLSQTTVAQSLGKSSNKPSNKITSLASSKNQMKFVGFYAAALTRVGAKTDYIEETAGVSNFIMVMSDNLEECISKIEKSKKLDRPVLLGITSILYQPGSVKLYPDYRQRFINYMSLLKNYESSIVGFYPLDEPNGNNRQMGANKISDQELYEEQELVNSMIHEIYPDKVTMTIFSPNETNENLLLPQHTDYIGFDCYWSFGSGCNTDLLIKRYEVLMKKKSPSQKLIAVIDSYIDHRPSLLEQKSIVERIEWWANFIYNKPEFAAVIPFLYQTELRIPGDTLHGAESMPLVKNKIMDLMKSYLPSSTSKMSDRPDRNKVVNPQRSVFVGERIIGTNFQGKSFYGTVTSLRPDGNPIVKMDEGYQGAWARNRVAITEGCTSNFCVGQLIEVTNTLHQKGEGLIHGLNFDGSLIVSTAGGYFGSWDLMHIQQYRISSITSPAKLKYSYEFIFQKVLELKKLSPKPEIPLPTLHLESQTSLTHFQNAIEKQWGLRPEVFTNAFAMASNEIFISDDESYYSKLGRCMDDSVAHELTHFVQVKYQGWELFDESLEWDAIEIQTQFRNLYCP